MTTKAGMTEKTRELQKTFREILRQEPQDDNQNRDDRKNQGTTEDIRRDPSTAKGAALG